MKNIIKKDILPVVIIFVVFPVVMSLCFIKNDPTALFGITCIQYYIIAPVVSIIMGIVRRKSKKRLGILSISVIITSAATSCLVLKTTVFLTIIPVICLAIGYIIGSAWKR